MYVECSALPPPSPLEIKQSKFRDITKAETSDTDRMKSTGHIYKWKRDLSA